MIPKNPYNLRMAYGLSLESAGLSNAIRLIDDLLDDGYQEKFMEYYLDANAFSTFKERFKITRHEVAGKFSWSFDRNIMAIEPADPQTIRDYFEKTFKIAIVSA